MDKRKIIYDTIYHERCKFHSDRIAKIRVMAEKSQTLFLCNSCFMELQKIKKEEGFSFQKITSVENPIELQNRGLFKSNSQVFIWRQQSFSQFGKKVIKAPPSVENSGWELIISLTEKPKEIVKLYGENVLKNEWGEYAFYYRMEDYTPLFMENNNEITFLTGLSIPPIIEKWRNEK